jgi:molybdenum cofactor cytidylyltransferase
MPSTGSSAFAAVVPAAGRAERFGGGKLIAEVRGEPLLNHTLRCLLDAGAADVVVVAALAVSLESVSLLTDRRVRIAINPSPGRGMFSSIQTGLAVLGDTHQILVLPGDMPFVRVDTVKRVVDAAALIRRPVTPIYQDRRGHPISLPAAVLAVLRSAASSRSLKEALLAAGVERVDLPIDDPGILHDVDVPADLP